MFNKGYGWWRKEEGKPCAQTQGRKKRRMEEEEGEQY